MTLHNDKSKNRNIFIIKILHINSPLSSKDYIISSLTLQSRLRTYISVEFFSRKMLNQNPQQMKIKLYDFSYGYVYRVFKKHFAAFRYYLLY